MEKILTKGIQKEIPYKLKIDYDFELYDDIKLILIDTDYDEEIGYLIYVENEYDNTISSIFEINDIISEYNPMYLKQIYINDEYRLYGFGNLLMQYFINNIIKDNICLLMKSAFGSGNFNLELDEKILPKFYEKFGFEQYKNSNWYLLNFDNI